MDCADDRRVIRRTRVDGGFRDITDGGALYHVSDLETLDGLVLRDAAVAIGAAEIDGMAPTVSVAAIISSLLRLFVA